MKYEMIPREIIKRVMDAFFNHSFTVNEKYRKFASGDKYSHSDRDRFVGRFFKKYTGKYIVLVDHEIFGYREGGYMATVTPKSVYSADRDEMLMSGVEPITRVKKKYMFISYFSAINEMYGSGYVNMYCHDIFDNQFSLRIDYGTLSSFQYREITADEFDSMAALFRDDRDDMEFRVTRYLDVDEMKKRKISLRKGLTKETVTVLAKDADTARKKLTNIIEVEPC